MSIYKNEKQLLEEQMWSIVLNATKEKGVIIDDASCDWFTVGNFTFIGSTEWLVSSDQEVANLVNAINVLNDNLHLVKQFEVEGRVSQ
ncbi:hypothetical protein [Bacillus pseudomycoides]|uniref:hypothetical protein n=1 Tax=Bacillus pseudomycoides TaxID=64104 RepID=UPI000BEE1722|nr:hypothetical protein [Bacillus pseudomycoides]PDY47467.1 hypothetical protein CON79_09415 [Bacillus pseudomycoides]PEA83789.1 hypothetical protein CON99_09475 [Bacillus pseudomycoides]